MVQVADTEPVAAGEREDCWLGRGAAVSLNSFTGGPYRSMLSQAGDGARDMRPPVTNLRGELSSIGARTVGAKTGRSGQPVLKTKTGRRLGRVGRPRGAR